MIAVYSPAQWFYYRYELPASINYKRKRTIQQMESFVFRGYLIRLFQIVGGLKAHKFFFVADPLTSQAKAFVHYRNHVLSSGDPHWGKEIYFGLERESTLRMIRQKAKRQINHHVNMRFPSWWLKSFKQKNERMKNGIY